MTKKEHLPSAKKNSVIVRMYNNASYTKEGDLAGCNPGTLYQTVHNRKYMEKDPNIDITKLKAKDLHDWQLVKRVEPTLDADGYADYICSIDKCGQTKHVVLPKTVWVTPSTPDVPSTPEVTRMPLHRTALHRLTRPPQTPPQPHRTWRRMQSRKPLLLLPLLLLPLCPRPVQTGWRWWAVPSAACSCWPQALCWTARTAV